MIAGLVIGGAVLAGGAFFFIRRGKKPVRPPNMMQPPPYQMPPQMQMQPQQMPPQQQMYGRVAPQGPTGVQPVAKTVAVQGPGASGGIAPTAFGSLSIGSLTCTRGQLVGQRFALTATGVIIGRQPGVAHVLGAIIAPPASTCGSGSRTASSSRSIRARRTARMSTTSNAGGSRVRSFAMATR